MADNQLVPEKDLPAEDVEERQAGLEINKEGVNKPSSDVEIPSGDQRAVGADETGNITPNPEIREDVDTLGDERSPENTQVLADDPEAEDVTLGPEKTEDLDSVGDNHSPGNSQVLADGSKREALSAASINSVQDTETTNEDALKKATTGANYEPESNGLEDKGSGTEQKSEEPLAEIDNEDVQNAATKNSNECDSPSTVLTEKQEETGEPSKNDEPVQRDDADIVDQVEEGPHPELQQVSKEMAEPQQGTEAEETQGNEVIEEHKSVVETAMPGEALLEDKASVPQPLVCENV